MDAQFPNAALVGTVGGILFAVHTCVGILCATYGRQSRSDAQFGGHFAASLVGFIILASIGIYGWILNPVTPVQRTRGITVAGSSATNVMVAFQIYEIVLAIIVPRLRGKNFEMVAHHLATLSLALLGGYYQYVDYYAVFFFGLTEISSVRILSCRDAHTYVTTWLVCVTGAIVSRRSDEAVPRATEAFPQAE